MTIEFLQLEDLLTLAEDLGVPKIRDIGLLHSAAHRPQTVVMGFDPYPSLHDKAAVLMESITRNHPLIDGNKRLGWMSVVVFYGLNRLQINAPEEDAYQLVMGVSSGAIDYETSAFQLNSWTTPR